MNRDINVVKMYRIPVTAMGRTLPRRIEKKFWPRERFRNLK